MHELKEASETVDEVLPLVASTNVDESLCDKLLNFSPPKVSVSRTGIKSACMEKMTPLKKCILKD